MIEVRKLNKTYDRRSANANHVLRDVSFQLPDTGFVCILGPSGCGKTSLLNALGGLDVFDNGTLATEDVSVSRYGTAAYERERNKNFGYIFQNYYLLEDHSVAYNVYLGLHSLALSHGEKMRRVRMALQAVDMERYIRRRVGELSGGQQQRIAIARALARRPKVIFADEPTGNLDEANTRNICNLLRQASKESLVIMVTHEERIARFYADRIITLESGQIREDSQSWDRQTLTASSDKVLYADDYQRQTIQGDSVSLELLREPGAEPVKLTVVSLADRVVIRLEDLRPITLNAVDIREGKRPVLTLETVDRQEDGDMELFREPPARECRAGKGVTGGMMLREARSLGRGKDLRRTGLRGFLALLTVLALVIAGDFIAISQVNPKDFIVDDSHILEIAMSRGSNDDGNQNVYGKYGTYWQDIHTLAALEGADMDVLPALPSTIECTVRLFYQMQQETVKFPACSQVLLRYLDPADLIAGRMPQSSDELVVDRLVLEAVLKQENTVAKSIGTAEAFLGMELSFGRKSYSPTIVGISDSGQRSIYMSQEAMVSLCSSGMPVITQSELKSRNPQAYGDLELESGTCLVFYNNAGAIYKQRIGQQFILGNSLNLTIVDAVDDPQMQASIAVPDEVVDRIILNSISKSVTLYCRNKDVSKAAIAQAVKPRELADITPEALAYSQEHPELTTAQVLRDCLNQEIGTDSPEKRALTQVQYLLHSDLLQISVKDPYATTYAAYQRAATIRADGRTVVVATLVVLSLVMLYLLCRAQVQARIELLAVYRLLGIPGRKLYGIFTLEALMAGIRTVLPAGVLTWCGLWVASQVPELALNLVLPWQVAVLVGVGIGGYYLLVSLLPLNRLLKLPPAQLAAKYDL